MNDHIVGGLPEPTIGTKQQQWRPAPRAVAVPSLAADPRPEWGRFALLSLLAAVGLLLIAGAYTAARYQAQWAPWLFWSGLLLMFVPVALRLAAPEPTRRERIALIWMLGMALYLVKVMYSPLAFTAHDELIHWRTAMAIMGSGHLFAEPSMIPVSPRFPGLEIVTAAAAQLTGLSVFAVALVLLGAARQILILALYLFYEEVSHSPQLAGLAILVYVSNPSFVGFSAAFAYESLSLSLAAMVLLSTVRWVSRPKAERRAWAVMLVLAMGAVVITHHLTSYGLAAFLVLWTFSDWYVRVMTRRREVASPVHLRDEADMAVGPGWVAALACAASGLWLVTVAPLTVSYLAPVMGPAFVELFRLVTLGTAGRQLFRSATGVLPIWWEPLVGYASAGLILWGLPFGLLGLWQRFRYSALALALGVAALAHPVTQALRLTWSGAETASRTSEFIFVALGFVLALAFRQWGAVGGPRWRLIGVAAALTVLFIGGEIVGTPFWARLPGPFLVSADSRSVGPEGVTAAQWTDTYLGPDHNVASDRVNDLLLQSYGQQRIISGALTADIFTTAAWQTAAARVAQLGVQYLVVDSRLTTGLPWTGTYYDNSEQGAFQHTTPVDGQALAKFDQIAGVSRLFDSGDIRIYDVRGQANAR